MKYFEVGFAAALSLGLGCGRPPDANGPSQPVVSTDDTTRADASNGVALAQVLRDGTDFSVDLIADDGPVCVTVPANLREPKICAGAVEIPTDDLTAAGSVLIGVAQRRAGNDVVVAVITASAESHPKVSDATMASAVTGMKSLMAYDKTAKVGSTPMEVSPAGTPHFAITIASLMQGTPIETRTQMLYSVDRTYSVSFVAMPRQHAANANWERAVIQSVRLARPAAYDPTYVSQ